tara:strand:+ start:462 stop:857 length:396 start_codon:yes stop_codon:yes gene_type:complete
MTLRPIPREPKNVKVFESFPCDYKTIAEILETLQELGVNPGEAEIESHNEYSSASASVNYTAYRFTQEEMEKKEEKFKVAMESYTKWHTENKKEIEEAIKKKKKTNEVRKKAKQMKEIEALRKKINKLENG